MAVDMRGIAENVCLVCVIEDLLKPKADETFADTNLNAYLEECRRARDRRASELADLVSDTSGGGSEAEAKLMTFDLLSAERRLAFIEGFISGVRIYKEISAL